MIKEINFSNRAVEKINQLIAKKPKGTFFRIAVKGGGCSGFKYDFTFDKKIDNDDLVQNMLHTITHNCEALQTVTFHNLTLHIMYFTESQYLILPSNRYNV